MSDKIDSVEKARQKLADIINEELPYEKLGEEMTPNDIALMVCQTAFKDVFDPNWIKLAHAYRDLKHVEQDNANLQSQIIEWQFSEAKLIKESNELQTAYRKLKERVASMENDIFKACREYWEHDENKPRPIFGVLVAILGTYIKDYPQRIEALKNCEVNDDKI